jgi:hypothetical protein
VGRWTLIAVLALAVLPGCGSDEGDEATTEGETEIALTAQNGSGQDGAAVLTEIDESTTRVEITLSNPGPDSQPAHIHRGSCARLEPQPEYPLESVMDGSSTSQVNVPVDDLLGKGFAINVHKSDTEIETYVSCGDVASGPASTETSTEETETETDRYDY